MEQNELVEARKWCLQAAVELLTEPKTGGVVQAKDVIAYAKELEAYIIEGKK
ncbi:unnamed protein product [marine sediment metagenome]|uniref:Uncharacterized protein n=1 Tax=marine sediment metagenome TaxID=412755 RepID=X1A6E8_9ZZZZ